MEEKTFTIEKSIEAFKKAIEVVKSKNKKEIEANKEYLKKIEYLKKLKEKGNLSKEEIERAFSVLCWSPEFCCGLSKPCPFRDSFWDMLGLGIEGYKEYKEGCRKLFWEFLRRKKVIQ